MTDSEVAAAIAAEAAVLLMQIRGERGVGAAVGAFGDNAANELLLSALRRLRPDDAVLSEESADDKIRLERRRVWIIDPLDGTREFSEGREDFAVHVALTDGGVPVAAAVALPARDEVLSTVAPMGFQAGGNSPMRMVVSRSRPPQYAASMAEELGAELVTMGSAGAKAMAVVRGEVDLYVHDGGVYEWDLCAPAGVALAAGLHVSRLDGLPLRYNNPDPLLSDLLICPPHLAMTALAAAARYRTQPAA